MRVMVYWAIVSPEATLNGSQLLDGPQAMRDASLLMQNKRLGGARFVGCAQEFDEEVGADQNMKKDTSQQPA